MNIKKIISMLLTLVMLMGAVSIYSISGTAAESLPANTVIVKLGATATDTTANYNGTEYSGLTFGTNLFATVQSAIDSAKDGDIILLCAGSYDEKAVYVSKNLTFKGAKAGVDPNLDQAEAAESKKLNPDRSLTDDTKETIIPYGGIWYVGYKAADTLADAETVTVNIDGVVFYKGWIQSQIQNVDKALYLNIKNCIANTTKNAFIFTNKGNTQYGDLYSRHITIENTRIENVGTESYTGMFGKLIADEFVLDNVYVAATNKSTQVTNEWLISKSENNPKFVVRNSTFNINSQAIMVDVWMQRNFATVSLANKESVTIEFDGNTFIGQANYAAIRPSITEELTNLKVVIKNNTFVSSQKPGVWSNQGKKIAPTCYEIDNNTFIDCKNDALITSLYVTSAVTATKTLCVLDGVAVIPTGDTTVSYGSYYKDVNKKVVVAPDAKISLVGVQTSTHTGKFDVRFVSVLNIDNIEDYNSVGYVVTIWKNDNQLAKDYEVAGTSVYSSIWAAGELISAESLGGEYIVALAIKNFEDTSDYRIEISAFIEDSTGAKYYDNIGAEVNITKGVVKQS